MTDYEILYEILGDCFWTGALVGAFRGDVAPQKAITVPAKIQELLDRLGLDMKDGYIIQGAAR